MTRSALAAPVATGVLDLRPLTEDRAARDAVVAAVGKRPGVTMIGSEWATALAGEADLAAAESLREKAMNSYAEQGCSAGLADDLRTVVGTFLQAADPEVVAERVKRPLELIAECAGDAATPAPTRVSITSEPTGARVFVNAARVGTSPVDLEVTGGEEWLVVHYPGRLRSVTRVPATSTHIVLGAAPARQLLEEQVTAWRAAGHQASAADITSIMRDARLELVVVLTAGGQAQIWTLGARAAVAKPAGKASIDDPSAVGEAVSGAVALLAPAGEVPPDGLPPEPKPAKKVLSPWIYAAVAGAVLLGAGLLYVTSSGGDTQRIEITFP